MADPTPHPWRDRLSEYVDGELTGGARAELEAHLAGCPDCRAVAAELRNIARAARALPARTPERDLWPELSRSLGAAASGGARRRALLAFAAGVLATLGAWLALELARGAPRSEVEVAAGDLFLLLLHGEGSDPIPQDPSAVAARYGRWARELGARCVGGEELAAGGFELRPGTEGVAITPRAGEDGVGGYFLLQAGDAEQALDLARTCPHLERGGWIELRRIQVHR